MPRSSCTKFETNINLGITNFSIDNINSKILKSQPVKLSLNVKKEEVKIINFDNDNDVDDLESVKPKNTSILENTEDEYADEKRPKLSPNKSTILSFMERKLSTDDAFYGVDK